MKHWLFSFLFYYFISPTVAQPYLQGQRSINFIDASRGNRVVNTLLFYPANSNGSNVPLATGTEKFPVVLFGHGFTIQHTAYQWLADSLVKQGFIVALPGTETGLSPSHEQFGRDLAFLCSRILSLNDSAGSFLFGRVLQKSAVGGHSMGGGCSLLAMGYNASINALFNFAAAETTPSAYTASLPVQKPALIYSGSSDCIVRDTVQQRMYNNIPYSCKTYINITNGLHCHFSNNDFTCATGQILSGCNTSSITAATVFDKISYLLVPFLQHYLKSDCNAKSTFNNNYAAITGVSKQQVCTADPQSPCTATGVNDLQNEAGVKVLSNPVVNNMLRIQSVKKLQRLSLYNYEGRLLQTQTPANLRVELSFTGYPPGCYLLTWQTATDKRGRQRIILPW
jgi:dienelactone hydrolase